MESKNEGYFWVMAFLFEKKRGQQSQTIITKLAQIRRDAKSKNKLYWK